MKILAVINLLLFNAILTVSAVEKIFCNDTYIRQLNENEIIFFESPNFPSLVNKIILNKCEIRITGNSTKNNMYLVLVLTNGYITNGKVERNLSEILEVTQKDNYFFTHGKTLRFFFSNSFVPGAEEEAFQGFLTYEKRTKTTCLLSQQKKPYQFKNEKDIYYLRSSFGGLNDREEYYEKRKCLWRFISLPGFGLKVDVLGTNIFSTNLQIVTESVREYITGPTTKYYNDTNTAISYNDKSGAFEAKVSLFKLLPEPLQQDVCLFNNDSLIWEVNPSTNYGSRIHCWKNIQIFPNFELKVTLSNYIFNETGNLLQFYTDEDKFFPFQLSENKEYIFLPHQNDTVRNLTFEFKSDENVVNQKFKMEFEIIECKCLPKKMDFGCLENISVIQSMMEREDHFYCAKHECVVEISTNDSCPDNHILLEVSLENNRKRYDSFTVYSDKEKLISIVNVSSVVEKDKSGQALILPNRKTFLFFKSSYDISEEYLDVVKLTLNITSTNQPIRLPNVTLSKNLSFLHNLELPLHSIATVNLPTNVSEGSYLELTFDPKKTENLYCIILFRDQNLSSRILIETPSLNLGSTVTIYNHQKYAENNILFVIKMRSEFSKTCLMKNTTLYSDGNHLSMIAGSEGPCEVVILNIPGGSTVKNLWTNSKIEDVILYSYSNKKQQLLKFNQNTTKVYEKMTFNSRVYVLEIPSNKSVLIEQSQGDIFLNKPLLSYYETKNYGAIFSKKAEKRVISNYSVTKNMVANFTVIDFDLSKNGYLQIAHSKFKKNFSLTNNSYIVKGIDGTKISLIYKDDEIGHKGALINIEVFEASDSTSLTTTKLPTTKYLSTITLYQDDAMQ